MPVAFPTLFHFFPVSLYSCLTRSYLLHVDTLGKHAVYHPASFKSLLKMSLLTKAVSGKGEGGQKKKAKRWPQPGDVTKPLLNNHSHDILPCIFLSSLFIYHQYLLSCSIHIETNLGKGDCVLFRSSPLRNARAGCARRHTEIKQPWVSLVSPLPWSKGYLLPHNCSPLSNDHITALPRNEKKKKITTKKQEIPSIVASTVTGCWESPICKMSVSSLKLLSVLVIMPEAL